MAITASASHAALPFRAAMSRAANAQHVVGWNSIVEAAMQDIELQEALLFGVPVLFFTMFALWIYAAAVAGLI